MQNFAKIKHAWTPQIQGQFETETTSLDWTYAWQCETHMNSF